jgi:predicted RNase H-like HicB family nuclease
MRTYMVVLERAQDGGWSAYVPDLSGCTSWGETRWAAAPNAKAAIETYIGALNENREPVPEPCAVSEFVSVSP